MKKFLLFLPLFILLFASCDKEDDNSTSSTEDLKIVTTPMNKITQNSASTGGTITGVSSSLITERGVVWGTSESPTITNSRTSDGKGSGTYVSNLAGLPTNGAFFVRAYVKMGTEFYYGNEVAFSTTVNSTPVVKTNRGTNILHRSFTTGGFLFSGGGSTIKSYGVCWSTSPNPVIADNSIVGSSTEFKYSISITGLLPNTNYYVRAWATNELGLGYGDEVIVRTLVPTAPQLKTVKASGLSDKSVVSGGNVPFDGGEYLTERGVYYSLKTLPLIPGDEIQKVTLPGTATGPFSVEITGLLSDTTYYLRPYAKNIIGTTYGVQDTIRTFKPDGTMGTVLDFVKNEYKTMVIHGRTWMLENLKTIKYNDGSVIEKVVDTEAWANRLSGAYTSYDNVTTGVSTYGNLYNWYAVNSGKLAPTGWHVATDEDWTDLINYLGGESAAGGLLKEADTTNWKSPNLTEDTVYGFNALPGGKRQTAGAFLGKRTHGYYWTSTPKSDNETAAWGRLMENSKKSVSREIYNKKWGFSVRCVKNP